MSKPAQRAHPLTDDDPLLLPPRGSVQLLQRPDGTRIRCVSRGAGPTVVLAHGYLLDLTLYNLVFDALVSAGHRVIAFDQRGHGASTIGGDGLGSAALVSDYAALLDHYEVEDGTLVGHSMGGFLSLVLCLREPDLVRRRLSRLVLLGANAGSVAQGSLQNRLQIPLLRFGNRATQRAQPVAASARAHAAVRAARGVARRHRSTHLRVGLRRSGGVRPAPLRTTSPAPRAARG